MLCYLAVALLVLCVCQLLLEPFVLLLETSQLFIAHSLLLVQLLVIAVILDRGVLFKRSPLVLQFLDLLL